MKDYIGHVFGRLTVTTDLPLEPGEHRRMICKCTCGRVKVVQLQHLKSGNTRSCGCLRADYRSALSTCARGLA